MVIITADDYGKARHATDSILKCFTAKRVTSTSAMVFMEDSERAAELASQTSLEIGLHLNFTMPFSVGNISSSLRDHHKKVISYLTKRKQVQIIYNPFLSESFSFLFLVQQEEFIRLYGKLPAFYNGHHHMHLCTNILAGKMIQKDARIRRTFKFYREEKNFFNRLYRHILNDYVSRKFISTDYFFSILPIQNYERLKNIFKLADDHSVEIEVHPENDGEIEFLLSDQYKSLIDSVHTGCFQYLSKKRFLRR